MIRVFLHLYSSIPRIHPQRPNAFRASSRSSSSSLPSLFLSNRLEQHLLHGARLGAEQSTGAAAAARQGVLVEFGQRLEEDQRHLVGRLLAPAHRLRRVVRVGRVVARVVVNPLAVDLRPRRQGQRLVVLVLLLPVPVPLRHVDQRLHLAVGEGGGHLDRLAEQVGVRREAEDLGAERNCEVLSR